MNCVSLKPNEDYHYFILQEIFLAMNRKIMEVVNSEDNGLRSFIGYNGSYVGYNGSYIGYIGYNGSYIGYNE